MKHEGNSSNKTRKSKTSTMSKKQKKNYDPNAKPILSWKILDDPDNLDGKVFWNSDIELTYVQKRWLRPLLYEMRAEFEELLRDFMDEPEYHYTIAGGNYSYFFILPEAMRYLQKRYPHMNVRLTILEAETAQDIVDSGVDLLLSGSYSYEPDLDSEHKKLNKYGYICSRKRYKDKVYLGASNDAIEYFGSVDTALQFHHLLLGRAYKTSEMKESERVKYSFSMMPKGRENEEPRITSDQYYLSHMLMNHDTGIWLLYNSMPKYKNLSALQYKASMKRYFIHKASFNMKKGYYVENKIMKMMEINRYEND